MYCFYTIMELLDHLVGNGRTGAYHHSRIPEKIVELREIRSCSRNFIYLTTDAVLPAIAG